MNTKRVNLTKQDIQRIELKFECLRRSAEYRKDYQHLQKVKKRNKARYESLESFYYSKWFHFPLLDPDVPISHYEKKLDRPKYHYWLERTLGDLISSDSYSPQPIKVESSELRKYLSWKEKGYRGQYNIKTGKYIRTPFKGEDEFLRYLDDKKVRDELRKVSLTLDMKGFTQNEIRRQLERLLKDLEPLKKKFLYGEKPLSIKPPYIPDYLKTYDEKKNASYAKMSDNQNQIRKFKKHVKIAKFLISVGWHHI